MSDTSTKAYYPLALLPTPAPPTQVPTRLAVETQLHDSEEVEAVAHKGHNLQSFDMPQRPHAAAGPVTKTEESIACSNSWMVAALKALQKRILLCDEWE